MNPKLCTFLSLLALVALLLPNVSQAQKESPNVGASVIPFNFVPPGARALGMGGAFVAIADDATASEANPAGLTTLTRPEVSFHGRSSSFDIEVDDLDAVNSVGLVNFFRGNLREIGTDVPNITANTTGTIGESTSSVSFVSYVQPIKGWVFSVYYQQISDFGGTTSFGSPNVFLDDVFADAYSTRRDLDIQADTFGISGAFRLGKLSIGASVRFSQMSFDLAETLRIDYFRDIEFNTDNFDHTDILLFQNQIDDDDDDVTFNVGLLYKPNGKFSMGLVYKQGGDFTVTETSEAISCIDVPGVINCNLSSRTGDGFDPEPGDPVLREFRIPDLLGFGIAIRPNDRFTIAIDVNEVTYSDLDPGLFDSLQMDLSDQDPDNDPFPELVDAVERVEDGTEFHFGLEYVVSAGQTGFTLRGGFFTEEDHDGFRNVDSDDTSLTAGLGIVIKQDLQIDLAGRFSDSVDAGLLSVVYRF